jgi:hypothetical protein
MGGQHQICLVKKSAEAYKILQMNMYSKAAECLPMPVS